MAALRGTQEAQRRSHPVISTRLALSRELDLVTTRVVSVSVSALLGFVVWQASGSVRVAAAICVFVLAFVSQAFAIEAALALQCFWLVLNLAGVSSALLTMAPAVLLILGLIGLAVRGRLRLRPAIMPLGIAVTVIVPGWLIVSHERVLSMLPALNLLLSPILAITVALHCSLPQLKSVFKFTTIAVVLNCVAAIAEAKTGVRGLLKFGLIYGTEVRNIGGLLRAPGLASDSASAGALAAALCIWSTAESMMPKLGVGRRTRIVGITASSVLLILATSRSAIALALIAILVLGLGRAGRQAGFRRRVGYAIIAIAMIAATIAYGATSTHSLGSRVAIWKSLLSGGIALFGRGLGSYGAATMSRYSAFPPRFTDNYWLSIVLQFGVWGFTVSCGWLMTAFVWLRRRRDSCASVVYAILISTCLTALTTEVWEYTAAVSILGIVCSIYASAWALDAPLESRTVVVL